MTKAKNIKIFISHQANDASASKALYNYISKCFPKLDTSEILFTSKNENNIILSEDWREYIRVSIEHTKVFISIISESYRDSEMCMIELGAAWGRGLKIIPLIAKGLEFSTFSQVIDAKQAGKLYDSNDLRKVIELISIELNEENVLSGIENHLASKACSKACGQKKKKKKIIKNPLRKTEDGTFYLVHNKNSQITRIMKIFKDKRIVYPDFYTYYFLGNEFTNIEVISAEEISKLEVKLLESILEAKPIQNKSSAWLKLNDTLHLIPDMETFHSWQKLCSTKKNVEILPEMTFEVLNKGVKIRKLCKNTDYKRELNQIVNTIINKSD